MISQDNLTTTQDVLLDSIADSIKDLVGELKIANTHLKRIGDCVNNLSAED